MSRALICAGVPAISLAQPSSPPPTGTLPPEPATPAPIPDTAAPIPQPPAGSTAAPPPVYAESSPSATHYEPPLPMKAPPPPKKPEGGFEMPAISVRLDPFNWLLRGRLGIEIEAELLPFLTVELVPMFVVNDQPPFLGQAFEDEVTQHSNGLGALAGTSLSAGFWFAGKPLRGNVFRVIFTNYALNYRSYEGALVIDELSHTERHLYAFLGSHSVFGNFFTIAGGFGLGMELNRQKRCFKGNVATSDCSKDELLLGRGPMRTDGSFPRAWDMTSFSYPVEILARISLGVTFF